MKTKIETKGIYARAAAILGIAVAVCFPPTSVYAQAGPEIQLIYYENSTRLNVYGVNFGSATGAVEIGGTPFPVLSWSPTYIQVGISQCSGGAGGPACLGASASYLFKLTTSTGQVARSTFATIDGKLASSMSDGYVTVTNVKINGGGSTAHVAAGASFTISGSYSIVDNSCPTCVDSVVVGLQTGATPSCLFEGEEGGAPGRTAEGKTTLTAPSANGIYNIVAHIGQNYCNTWDYGVPGDAYAIGAIAVY
jgi:hypothetical protein